MNLKLKAKSRLLNTMETVRPKIHRQKIPAFKEKNNSLSIKDVCVLKVLRFLSFRRLIYVSSVTDISA